MSPHSTGRVTSDQSRSIELRELDRASVADWDAGVQDAPGASIFHQSAALEVLERHSGTTLHLLAGYNGEHLVGLFPIFSLSKGPFSVAFSPPHRLGVPSLGPLMTTAPGMKQTKRERYNCEFVEACLEWLSEDLGANFFCGFTTAEYDDVRPFEWYGYDVTPRFTYHLDVTRPESELLGQFKRSLRNNIARTDPDEYEISEGGHDAIEFVMQHVAERYAAQGRRYKLTADFVCDLYDSLPDGQVRPYVAAVDGEVVSGMVVLEYAGTCYYWQGGGKPDVRLPINDVLYYRILCDARERGMTRCDFVGGNTPRLCRYKAKFNPTVVTYYELRTESTLLTFAESVYRRLQ
jgi:hypothetical protein